LEPDAAASFILRLEEHPDHARQGSAGVSSARVGHIDPCVEQQVELNRVGHFLESCSDRDESGIAASVGFAMDSCDAMF